MVTSMVEKLVKEEGKHYDVCVAIGPMIMMKFTCLMTKDLGIPTIVSMNPIMVDGNRNVRCMPSARRRRSEVRMRRRSEFDGHLVDFDEAMKRQQMYRTEEGRAMLRLQEGNTHHGGCGNCGGDN